MGTIGRLVAIALPVFVVLLIALPFTGMGAVGCLSAAILLTGATVWWAERRRARRLGAARAAAAQGETAYRQPMGPLTAAALTLGGVLLLIYVILVIRAA